MKAIRWPSSTSKAKVFGRALGQPDDEAGGEQPPDPDRILFLANEDLVAVAHRFAFQGDPLVVAAELVLEAFEELEAELALDPELGQVGDDLGHLDVDQGERVVGLRVDARAVPADTSV